jgi:L-aminopeptidase/D-esterase-like protein
MTMRGLGSAALLLGGVALVASLTGQQRAASRGITDVQGIRVGHHTLTERPTGCTVILADGQGAVGGVSQRGGAPGTVETNLLDPANVVENVNAIVLSGGSAFGLDARSGVVKYLEERKIGYSVSAAGVVPIVAGAILFDLGFGGDSKIRPTADCGYRAATAATDGAVQEGNVGAGAGATVGKMGGPGRTAMKAGIGSASISLGNGLVVGAIVAVNAIGDIIDPMTGRVVAGTRNSDGTLADARRVLRETQAAAPSRPVENTTIAVVATNARLTKAQAHRMAMMADDGLARAIYPSHTLFDGDTVFALATGRWEGQVNLTVVGGLAAEALSEAVVRAATQASASRGLPSARDTGTVPDRFK